jgi:hypothetical protein
MTATAAAPATRTFRPRKDRYRRVVLWLGVFLFAMIGVLQWLTTLVRLEHQAGAQGWVLIMGTFYLLVLELMAASLWRFDRLALVVGEQEIIDQGRLGSKTIPFTHIRGASVDSEGHLMLALRHGYSIDLRGFVELEDRDEFVALVNARAASKS